jgi:integrase
MPATKHRRTPKRVHQYLPPPPPPTREQLRTILGKAPNAKTRATLALMAFAGLRPHHIQALTLKDIPDLTLQSNSVQFMTTPAKIIPQSIWRNPSVRTFTFLPEPGCTYLTDSLKERQAKGERLTAQSQGIPSPAPTTIALMTKQTFSAAGYAFKPLDLRRYFLVQLMAAEAEGLIPHQIREFISGYAVRAPLMTIRLTPQLEQTMRDAYKRSSEKYLIP